MASRAVRELSLASLQPVERPRTVLCKDVVSARATARAVEFVAKPGQTDELRSFLCQAVAPLFTDRTGFIRTMVLTTHGAPRRVQMITFWCTERRVRDLGVEVPVVRERLSELIDVESKTISYQVDLTEATEPPGHAVSALVANRNAISATVRQQFS